jgi:type IV secretion system protein VirB2
MPRVSIRNTHLCAAGLLTLIICFAATNPTLAQTLTPLENVADTIVNFLSGAFVRSLAIIAVIACGVLFFTGRLRLTVVVSIVIGIALVFGAAAIVDALSGAV